MAAETLRDLWALVTTCPPNEWAWRWIGRGRIKRSAKKLVAALEAANKGKPLVTLEASDG